MYCFQTRGLYSHDQPDSIRAVLTNEQVTPSAGLEFPTTGRDTESAEEMGGNGGLRDEACLDYVVRQLRQRSGDACSGCVRSDRRAPKSSRVLHRKADNERAPPG